jgi:hypothetical protein
MDEFLGYHGWMLELWDFIFKSTGFQDAVFSTNCEISLTRFMADLTSIYLILERMVRYNVP